MFRASSLNPTAFLLLVLLLTFLVYLPGLQGGFLFDDLPNLKELGAYGGIVDFNTLKAFVLNGSSGPTGRPLSLLSFLLNDYTWPSHAYSFKLTNLWIHILSGLVLCWATLLLLRFYGVREHRAVWVAVLSSSIWLLHPYFVSTTLYVVQRMAQLAALFMFAGLAGYLHGRMLIARKPLAGYAWMTFSVGVGTLLAVLSKENGALLPLLIVVVDFCQPRSFLPAPAKTWRIVIVWLPALVVVGALAKMIDFSPDLWPVRPFNQPERLLSEGRIIWEYLFHLFVPQIEGRGLFQDGYEISRGWFSPVSGLYAAAGVFALLAAGIVLRKKWPFFSLAILFYLASHLMESSVVGLELYFEHRNYAAAAFLFLPIAFGLCHLRGKVKPQLADGVTGLIFLLLLLMTWQRANLWGDTSKLELYWAVSTPDSPRAQNAVAAYLMNQGRVEEGNAQLEKAIARLPNSSLLTIRLLLQKVYSGLAVQSDFAIASSKLSGQPFDAQAVVGLRALVDKVTEPGSNPAYRDYSLHLIDVMDSNSNYQRIGVFQRTAPYLRAQLYVAQRLPDLARPEYSLAMTRYVDTEASLMMVAELARAGYQEYALQLLPQAKAIYRDQPHGSLRRSPAEYDDEFARLEKDLLSDIAARNSASPEPE